MKSKVLILAGGAGTRLWPASTEENPKQFLRIGTKSLLGATVERIAPVAGDGIWISTNERYVAATRRELGGSFSPDRVLAEPLRRNTAPAIALCIDRLVTAGDLAPDDVLSILPADQHMSDPARFRRDLSLAAEEAGATGRIGVLGIRPTRPETGYGYVEVGVAGATGAVDGVRFVEKPNHETAERFLAGGKHLWNAGIFVGTAAALLHTFERHAGEILAGARRAEALRRAGDFDGSCREFSTLPDLSIDYAVMEKIDRFFVVPSDCGWSDVGSWESLGELLAESAGNRVQGEAVARDATGNVVYGSPDRPVVLIGVDGLVVVDGPAGILVARAGRSPEVKEARTAK